MRACLALAASKELARLDSWEPRDSLGPRKAELGESAAKGGRDWPGLDSNSLEEALEWK